MVGNLDTWRTRIDQIHAKSPNSAYLVMGLADRGDVIDLDEIGHCLPKDVAELQSGRASTWSLMCPPSQERKILGSPAIAKRAWGAPEKFAPDGLRIYRLPDKLKDGAKERLAGAEGRNMRLMELSTV